MKKNILSVVGICMLLGLTGCGSGETVPDVKAEEADVDSVHEEEADEDMQTEAGEESSMQTAADTGRIIRWMRKSRM